MLIRTTQLSSTFNNYNKYDKTDTKVHLEDVWPTWASLMDRMWVVKRNKNKSIVT